MMQYINKYSKLIIIILLCLFMFKSCQSCSKSRRIDYIEYNHKLEIDSIRILNKKYIIENGKLRDSIGFYKAEIIQLNDKIELLKGYNKHYQTTNKILLNNNEKLINNDYEKSK